MRLESVRMPKNSALPMNLNAILIDWKKAISEVEKFIDLECKQKRNRTIDGVDASLYALNILCKVKDMYRKDDVEEYLNLLDDNRKYLKQGE